MTVEHLRDLEATAEPVSPGVRAAVDRMNRTAVLSFRPPSRMHAAEYAGQWSDQFCTPSVSVIGGCYSVVVVQATHPEEPPADLGRSERAGGSREEPAFVRGVSEREHAKEAEAELQAMFDHAWESLSPEEREAERRDREALLGGYAGNEKA